VNVAKEVRRSAQEVRI